MNINPITNTATTLPTTEQQARIIKWEMVAHEYPSTYRPGILMGRLLYENSKCEGCDGDFVSRATYEGIEVYSRRDCNGLSAIETRLEGLMESMPNINIISLIREETGLGFIDCRELLFKYKNRYE